MELGRFFNKVENDNISYILSQIVNDEIKSIYQVCERYGVEEDEVYRRKI